MSVSPIEFCPVPNRERGDRMPRIARRRSNTDFYHVIARGINKEPIFKQKREKNNFLGFFWSILKIAKLKYMRMRSCLRIFIFCFALIWNSYLIIWPLSWQYLHNITTLNTIVTDMFFRIDSKVNAWRNGSIFGIVDGISTWILWMQML